MVGTCSSMEVAVVCRRVSSSRAVVGAAGRQVITRGSRSRVRREEVRRFEGGGGEGRSGCWEWGGVGAVEYEGRGEFGVANGGVGGWNMADGGQKAVNEMRVAQGAMAGRGASTMGGSPGAQGSSQRGQGGGGSGSKGGMGQASNLGDVGQSRTSGMMSSSMSGGGGSGGSMSNGQSKNSSSGNVESGGDGRGGTNEGSLQQGGGSGSHGAGGGGVVGSSPIAGMGGQAPTSVVQQ